MTLLPDGTWIGKRTQAPRGCSLGNASTFLRATSLADVDGVWLAENGHWYTGELSVTPLPMADWEVQDVVYAPEYQGVIYQRADGAEIVKKLLLDTKRASLQISLEAHYLPEGTPLTCAVRWRTGAALSDIHRQQPYGYIEKRWSSRVTKNAVYAVSTAQEEKTQQLASSAPFEKPRWTEPNLFTAEFRCIANDLGRLDASICLTIEAEDIPKSTHLPIKPMEDTSLPDNSLIPYAHQWGQVCSHRVFHRYGTGDWGFTNDPPGNTVVTRDCAWYIFGSDYFAPELSAKLLTTLKKHCIYPSGKVAEYVRLERGNISIDDYGLNINDATPLFLLALAHHHHLRNLQGQPYPLAETQADFALAKQCADWILQQSNADGLVWCDAKGTNVWGIGGWRNIIPAYRLAGALTELNALCVAALRAVARLATYAQQPELAEKYSLYTENLNKAMSQLVNPDTGMFYLNRDENGVNPQIAVDCAFPALFHAGPEEAQQRTLLRLLEPDFRCSHGILTLSRNDTAFHPRYGWGLMGGSWYNATAWVSAALSRYDTAGAWQLAEQLAAALFPRSEVSRGVSVPGQFPEWYDPERAESAGMSLSPWMPATFVWLIEEGLKEGGVL